MPKKFIHRDDRTFITVEIEVDYCVSCENPMAPRLLTYSYMLAALVADQLEEYKFVSAFSRKPDGSKPFCIECARKLKITSEE